MDFNLKNEFEEKSISEEKAKIISNIKNVANDYITLKNHPGWKRFEKEILERIASLSKDLCSLLDEKKIYRTQGELLGLSSALGILDVAIEDLKNIESMEGEA